MELAFTSTPADGIVDSAALGDEYHVRLVGNPDGTVTAHACGACGICDGYGHVETVIGMTWAEGPVTAVGPCDAEECTHGEVAVTQTIDADDVKNFAIHAATAEQRAFFAAVANAARVAA